MKRVLIVCNNLNHGGIPRALVNLLKNVSGGSQIDLLLFEPSGDYMGELPANVRLLPSEGDLYLLGIPQDKLKRRSAGAALKRAFYVAVSRAFGNRWARERVFRTAGELSGYDAAISYVQDNGDHAFAIGCNDFVLQKVRAGLKIAYVHCDMEHYEGNTPGMLASYYEFDRIACVSEGCRRAFVRVCPELEDRTYTASNFSDYEDIIRKGAEPADIPSYDGGLTMVTVARLNPEKGFLRAIDALAPLMREHRDLRWHIVGGGPDEAAIREAVKAAGIDGQVMLFGMQDNPYPYVKAADLMLLPSIHEAAPMVYEEARALGVPVLTTATTSAADMVEARHSGYVCGNSAEGIRSGVQRILDHPEILARTAEELRREPCDNSIAAEQWLELIGEKSCS